MSDIWKSTLRRLGILQRETAEQIYKDHGMWLDSFADRNKKQCKNCKNLCQNIANFCNNCGNKFK